MIKYALQKKEFSAENRKKTHIKLVTIILLTACANISTKFNRSVYNASSNEFILAVFNLGEIYEKSNLDSA